jgi:hypothetical protein
MLLFDSAIKLAFTVFKFVALKQYLSAWDVGVLAVSGSMHGAASGTSFYLGWQYGHEVLRFQTQLERALKVPCYLVSLRKIVSL